MSNEFSDFEQKLMSMIVRQADSISNLQGMCETLKNRIDTVQTNQFSIGDVDERIAAWCNVELEREVSSQVEEAMREHDGVSEQDVERIVADAVEESMRDFDVDEKITEYLTNVKLSVNIEG